MNTSITSDTNGRFDSLFPLPLVPFERFMLADDRTSHPMTFMIEVVFAGSMDRDAVQQAVVAAQRRHPLLSATISSGPRSQWQLIPSLTTLVCWIDADTAIWPPAGTYVDLRKEHGLAVWATIRDGHTRVMFQFHHACCDGLGARTYLTDFLVAYARSAASATERPEWPRLDYEPLRRRGVFGSDSAAGETSSDNPAGTSLARKVTDAYAFLWGQLPTPIPRSQPEVASHRHSTRMGTTALVRPSNHAFSRAESRRLLDKADRLGIWINDVAIALLFTTLASWMQDQQPTLHKGWLRLLMPTNLRQYSDRRLTATNRMSYSFLARQVGACSDLSALVANIAAETRYLKNAKPSLDFLMLMSAVQRIPGMLRLFLGMPQCMGTAVLSNLGEGTRHVRRRFPERNGNMLVGDVELRYFIGVPPIRPGTRAAFGLCFTNGHMVLGLRIDHIVGDESTAQQLMERYVTAWRDWGEFAASSAYKAERVSQHR
ncbi:MAG: hypothetical protein R3E01_06505 [Pirellulaceae bacterium]|nr:hypothetical protein [Planctomycetales bacterium]